MMVICCYERRLVGDSRICITSGELHFLFLLILLFDSRFVVLAMGTDLKTRIPGWDEAR